MEVSAAEIYVSNYVALVEGEAKRITFLEFFFTDSLLFKHIYTTFTSVSLPEIFTIIEGRVLRFLLLVVGPYASYVEEEAGCLELLVACLLVHVLLLVVFYCSYYSIKAISLPYPLPPLIYFLCKC